MVKTIKHPETGKTICFGRRRPIVEYPRLSLSNYVMKALPSPPSKIDYSADAMAALKLIYMNDSLGICVLASKAHMAGIFTGNAGTPPVIFTDGQMVNLYSILGGYVPGDPSTDQGCDMTAVLSFYKNAGLMPGHKPGQKHKIAGWMAVDPSNVEEIKTALWLFENCDIGMELPDAWINPNFPSANGFVWDAAGSPDPNNGHCICGVGYDDSGVTVDTWGLIGTLTWRAIAEYAASKNNGELYTVVSTDILSRATAKAPAGLAWNQLCADFASLGGKFSLAPPQEAVEP